MTGAGLYYDNAMPDGFAAVETVDGVRQLETRWQIANGAVYWLPPSPLEKGTYILQCDCMVESNTGGYKTVVSALGRRDIGDNYNVLRQDVAAFDVWETHTSTVTVPADADYCVVLGLDINPNRDIWTYFRDIRVTKKEE